MPGKFVHTDLRLIEPDFGSSLTDLIIELDYLRKKPFDGSTHPAIFSQLKNIFHTMESIGSARIEGNHTTIAEFIETKIYVGETVSEEITEIQNIEKAIGFIDENISNTPVNRAFLSELHRQVVSNLSREGSMNPGQYRKVNPRIAKSMHRPPDYNQVAYYMDELFGFINTNDPSKYDLLKTAIAHHRFVWIHPFDNGNGRTVRLLTYSMLVKQGFNVNVGRILNPTAIFCSDRERYYHALGMADTGSRDGIISWCEYVLAGLKQEIEKIDRLLDYNYLGRHILTPALHYAAERRLITDMEASILHVAVRKQVFQASDVRELLPDKLPAEVSRILRRMREKNLLRPENDNSRKYVISFNNNYILRGVIKMLGDNNFLPMND